MGFRDSSSTSDAESDVNDFLDVLLSGWLATSSGRNAFSSTNEQPRLETPTITRIGAK